MNKNKRYSFNAEIVDRMTVKVISISDSDYLKFKETIKDFSVGDKLKLVLIKQ